MIDAANIAEILATYKKHGWILRRVLLSAAAKEKLGDARKRLFGEIESTESMIDAAWFSRPPKEGGVAWEIRYLGEIPFALLTKTDESHPDFESDLKDIESRLRELVTRKQTA